MKMLQLDINFQVLTKFLRKLNFIITTTIINMKSIFDKTIRDELIARINSLNEKSTAQ